MAEVIVVNRSGGDNPTVRSIRATFTVQTVGWLENRRRASNNPEPWWYSRFPWDTNPV